MRLNGRPMREQRIECAIEAILIDMCLVELKQIGERRAAIPILGNVQLARRLAQARRDQYGRHLLPRDALLALRQQLLQQLPQPDAAPQRQRQIYVPEPPRALEAYALQAHRDRRPLGPVIEEPGLLRCADQLACRRTRFDPTVLIELTKVGHRLLNDSLSDALRTSRQ